MRGIGGLSLGHAAIAFAVGLGGAPAVEAQQAGSGQVVIAADDIGGVVQGPNGPEAGVWVIAETDDLPTKFAKIVVTDDAGRYVVPQLAEGEVPSFGYLGGAPFKFFGDWTDRIAKGELPHSKPPRPQGAERNIVVTSWE